MSAFDPLRTLSERGETTFMTRLGPDPKDWLPELRRILTAIGSALGERSPSAPLVMALRADYERCVAGHTVQIEYFPEGYTDDPDRLPEYAVPLTGERFLSSWLLLERDFNSFIRTAIPKG